MTTLADLPIPYAELAPRPPEGTIDLPALVPGAGPLELDIGFGRGRSLMTRAAGEPERRFVGVEIKSKWAYLVAQRLEREGLRNGRAYCADARIFLERARPDACLDRVFLHFPDPWWKKRHAKRRIFEPSLLDSLARLVCVDGQLFVQTDVVDRAADYLRLLSDHPAFAPVHPEGFEVSSNPFGLLSNREVRAQEDGLPVYRLLARRIACPRVFTSDVLGETVSGDTDESE